MGLRVITQPTVEPVSLAEAKQDLRVEHTDDDAKIARHIAAAREFIEQRIQRKIASQELEFTIDAFPSFEIKLPVGPVQEVTGIFYDDEEGFEQEIISDDYWLDNTGFDSWVFPSVAWPGTLDGVNAVRVNYLAGYATPDETPAPLKAAIQLKIQELYDGGDYSRAVGDLITNYLTMVA